MNNMRCKPGDLAIVIKAKFSSNLGRLVRVVRQSQGEGDLVYPTSEPSWWVECSHPMTWYKDKKRYQRNRGPVPDAQLQPIRSLPPGRDIADGIWKLDSDFMDLPRINRRQKTC